MFYLRRVQIKKKKSLIVGIFFIQGTVVGMLKTCVMLFNWEILNHSLGYF